MKIYDYGKNWIIEDKLECDLIDKIYKILKENENYLFEDKKNFSTKGENAEQFWIIRESKSFLKDNSDFYDIEKEYKNKILTNLKKLSIFKEKIKDNISLHFENSWTVIGGENSYHAVHNHGNADELITTVLYINVPYTNLENKPENNLFLIMNSDILPRFYQNLPNVVTINPEYGKLLIFPGWILHGTYPQTKGIRQTFNIDYSLRLHQKYNISKLTKYH